MSTTFVKFGSLELNMEYGPERDKKQLVQLLHYLSKLYSLILKREITKLFFIKCVT